jgi:hypothetical protein
MLKHALRDADADGHDVHASLCRQGPTDRQRSGLTALPSDHCDQKPWGLLYQALTEALGASPDAFQLLHPFTVRPPHRPAAVCRISPGAGRGWLDIQLPVRATPSPRIQGGCIPAVLPRRVAHCVKQATRHVD